ncbi:MAG: hypothetical protein A2882_16295 [Phenylobacterium sp. RIFCSPHIGHO2_01_FULL_70_10]|nr:MAG: hypothetical protein A2882_16295 [Phenylobacterium sp. RIFCSPHIGHO2_01_FULL_70_10]
MTDTDTTTPEAVASEAPKASKLTVKRVKAEAPVVHVAKDDRDAEVAPEGTRMETDAGPVQGTFITGKPREVEELEFPGLKIIRQRF